MIGLSRESVNRIENGEHLPRRKIITKIADVLNTKDERLFERAKIPYKTKFPVYDKKKVRKDLTDSFNEAVNLEEFMFQCALIWKKTKTEDDGRYDLSYLDEEFKKLAHNTNIEINLVELSKIIIETFTPLTVMNLVKEILIGDYSVYLQGDSEARKVMIETAANLERFAKLYPKQEIPSDNFDEIPVVEFGDILK